MSPPTNGPPDLKGMTFLRPAEIKTYHQTTYDRISPSKTFEGKGKTVLITGGGGCSWDDSTLHHPRTNTL